MAALQATPEEQAREFDKRLEEQALAHGTTVEAHRRRVAELDAERRRHPLTPINDLMLAHFAVRLFNKKRNDPKLRWPVKRPSKPFRGERPPELVKLEDEADALIRAITAMQQQLFEVVGDRVPGECILDLQRSSTLIRKSDGTPQYWTAPTVCSDEELDRANKALRRLWIRVAATGGAKPGDEITLAEAAKRFGVDKSDLSKACKRPKSNPRYLPHRRKGRSVFVSRRVAATWCADFKARRDAKTHRKSVKNAYSGRA